MDKRFTATLSRSQGRSAWAVIFRHPARLDPNTSKPGLRVRMGLGTADDSEAGILREQLNQLLADENFWNASARSEAAQRFHSRVVEIFFHGMEPEANDFGASRDAIDYAVQVAERELAAVTDNPTVFPEENMIVSAGNFHGQPLALVLDFLAMALAELGSISERRTYKLISGQRGLPAFLVAKPGLNSGFMIPQYTAASLVSANKMRCMPNSVDTIDSSNGQEDHVSMGAAGAIKCWDVLHDVERILAIELLNAAQALDFRRPLRSSPELEDLHARFRKQVAFIEDDVVMYDLMENATAFVRSA